MPQMADITVKKADGTTNVVYVAKTPSSGDTSAARWTLDAQSTYAANRPALSLTSRDNGPKTGRRMVMNYAYPVTRLDAQNNEYLFSTIPFEISALIPTGVPDAAVNEAVAQATNLAASVLIRQSFSSGYSPS